MSDDQFRLALGAFQRGDMTTARRAAQQQLSAAPAHAPSEHLLGLIECRAGQIDRGLVHLRRAVALDPANPGFRLMFARALIDSGAGAEALRIAAKPAGPLKDHSGAWHVRAEAADAAGDDAAAAEAWTALARLNSGDWRAWSNAGTALARLERWREAADALIAARRLNPDELALRRNLLSALVNAARWDEAAQEAGDLLDRSPDDGATRMLYAQVLTELADHPQALAQYDEAVRRCLAAAGGRSGRALLELARAPGGGVDADRLRSLGSLLDRTNQIEPLRALLSAAAEAGVDNGILSNSAAALALRDGDPDRARDILLAKPAIDDPVYHHRLLAKIEDRRGDVAAAFAASTAMNRAVADYDGWRRKAADYRARLRAMRKEAERSITGIEPLAPAKRRSPAFLVGFPRSGTTLLDTFLMGHPETAVLEEVHMVGAAEAALGGANGLDRRDAGALTAARDAYFAELDRHLDPDFRGLVVDKLPLNMLGLPLIYALFPDARIIFAQRHPCDCVLSGFTQSFVLNDAMASFLDLGDAADLYDAALDQFTYTRERLPLAVHGLVYERLVATPERELRPLIDFLGLRWDDSLLDHQATARSRGAIITPSYDQVVRPLDAAPSGRWRRYRKQLEPVLAVLLPWAERLGYGVEA